MKIVRDGETLNVSELEELAAANSSSFRTRITSALPAAVRNIEIDLSQTAFVDCGGVGALVAMRNCARRHNSDVAVRLLNPKPPVRRIFDLTGMEGVFSIEDR